MVRVTASLLILGLTMAIQALPELEYESSSSYSKSDLSKPDSYENPAPNSKVVHTKKKSGPSGSTTVSTIENFNNGDPRCVLKVQESDGDGQEQKRVEKCEPGSKP
ncbi:hypothetical protein K493DRAFT_319536 [Basidiobolus meristosporus CBS 931.73]|uniref:Uncharacterized protein n=1 Tax=Basidiobolus meristosporus CBS 931.73 TaxID=1314790 RepID=A0A1Y1XRE3_9FUNG|nr:hypothetical protein K493DRAFT_319536 [Basidiobolus meristosporus CBS 931.73]|eukprot:ORX88328.1 hypothetical protein K493DRAFT_319536 [Basidiobolus meristosporus CBS 931.73]